MVRTVDKYSVESSKSEIALSNTENEFFRFDAFLFNSINFSFIVNKNK